MYQFTFRSAVDLDVVETALDLAITAVAGLHGGASVRLDVRHLLDRDAHTCLVDDSTAAGRDLVRVFAELLRTEVGDGGFAVARRLAGAT